MTAEEIVAKLDNVTDRFKEQQLRPTIGLGQQEWTTLSTWLGERCVFKASNQAHIAYNGIRIFQLPEGAEGIWLKLA